jgi:hypothetical protein
MATHTGANGDTAQFSGTGADNAGVNNRVDHEASPATALGEHASDVLGSLGNQPTSSSSELGSGASSVAGATFRAPEGRGVAGDFDDWNPRGEQGAGGPHVEGNSMLQRAQGACAAAPSLPARC